MRQCLIDRNQNLARIQLIETRRGAVEAAFAAFPLAWRTRQCVLYQPDITAALDRAGGAP